MSEVEASGSMDDFFTSQTVPDSVWHLMQGRTFRPNPHIRRSDLRYLRLLHIGSHGEPQMGEMVCNKAVAADLIRIFRRLFDRRYVIDLMILPDNFDADDERQMTANNTSCFCYRPVSGSKSLSKHALGLAVDINPLFNPCVRGTKVEPESGRQYADRTKQNPRFIRRGDLLWHLFTESGFRWGGSWRSLKDYQHFEK